MGLNPNAIIPRGGRFYAHLFENPLVGVERNLFWCLAVEFETVNYLDQNWDISAAVEWLRFDKDCTPLTSEVAATAGSQPDAEASFYLAEHWPSDEWQVRIRSTEERNLWRLEFDLAVDFGGLDDDPVPDLRISGSSSITFDGIVVVRENLSPPPNSEQEAASMLADYFDLDDRYRCADEGWRYRFHLR